MPPAVDRPALKTKQRQPGAELHLAVAVDKDILHQTGSFSQLTRDKNDRRNGLAWFGGTTNAALGDGALKGRSNAFFCARSALYAAG